MALPDPDTALPGNRLGALAAGGSLLCAVHCLLAPVALGVAPLLGAHLVVEGTLEAGLIGTALVAGGFSLWRSYGRHGRLGPLAAFSAGAALLAGGHAPVPWPPLWLGMGGLALAGAQGLDRRLARRAACCDRGH